MLTCLFRQVMTAAGIGRRWLLRARLDPADCRIGCRLLVEEGKGGRLAGRGVGWVPCLGRPAGSAEAWGFRRPDGRDAELVVEEGDD